MTDLAAAILPQSGSEVIDPDGNRKRKAGRLGPCRWGGQHRCDERRQGIGRVPVKGMSRPVVAAGSTRVGMAGGSRLGKRNRPRRAGAFSHPTSRRPRCNG